jgi:hypothetical protein
MTDTAIIEKEEILKNKTILYVSLHKEDPHAIRLLHWIKTLEDMRDEVLSTEMDEELAQNLQEIASRLIREVGTRVSMIIP